LAQQTTVAIVNQHDHYGIGAWKVLGFAFGAFTNLSASPHVCFVAADRAKSVSAIPVQLRFCLG
jgi:hypothetical protein